MRRNTSKNQTGITAKGIAIVGTCLLAAIFTGQADGQATWLGGAGDWNTGSNWDTGLVPGSGDALVDSGNATNSQVTVGASQSATIGNVFIDSGDSLEILNNSNFTVTSSIQNEGQFLLSTLGSATRLRVESGNVQLSGSGTMTMGGTNSQARIEDQGGGSDAHFLSSSTIEGFGNIGVNSLQLTNQAGGTINANVAATTLQVDPGTAGMVNAGLMTASNGGELLLSGGGGGGFSNSGVIQAEDGSQVRLTGIAAINGGTLTTSGTGRFVVEASDNAELTDVDFSGQFDVLNNSDLELKGTINNQGNISMETLGSNVDLQIESAVTLTGGGSITMGGTSNAVRILDENGTADGSLTNVNNLIEGRGNIGFNRMSFVNEADGVVDANVAGAALIVDPNAGNMTNNGLMRASNGGELQLTGSGGGVFNNSAGAIRAEDGSQVRLTGIAAINGGTLSTLGNGRFLVDASDNAELTDVDFSGQFDVLNNSDLELKGTINNQGNISMQTLGSNVDLQIESAVTLTGGGSITMGGTSGAVRILDENGTADGSLTNVDNLIEGRGSIGADRMSFINEVDGVVDANVTGASLVINPNAGNVTNNGLMKASNGSELRLDGGGDGVFNNSAGTIRAEDGSQVRLGNIASVVGGNLEATSDSRFVVEQSDNAELTDVNFSGQFDVLNNADLELKGTIDNQGDISMQTLGSSVDLQIESDVTLTGGGSITMGGTSTAVRINDEVGTADGVLTNVDNTIQGKGQIGNNRLNVINQALIDANDDTGSITLNPRSTGDQFVNTGTLRASGGGALVLHGAGGGDFFNDGGVIEALDDSTVRLAGIASVEGGELRTLGTGHFVVGPSDNAELADLTLNGTFDVMNNSDLELFGNINNQGTINVVGGGSNTDIQVESAVSLTGGGVIALDAAFANTRIVDEVGSADGELTNVDNTIQGRGVIGNNRLKFINDAGGTVNANAMGASLQLNSRDGNTNQGFFIASNEGTFDIVGDLMNDGMVQADLNSLVDASGVLTNNSTGSLVGNGEIEAVSINNDGRIAPGASVGTLTLDADTVFGSTSFLDMEVDSTAADFLSVLGQLQLDGELGLSLLDGFIPTVSDQYVLAMADDPILGSFNNVFNGGTLETLGGEGTFDVHYGASSSFGTNSVVINNFNFTGVPEPGSMSVLLALMTSTLLVRRRRA
jgi:hypothetical protein